MQLKSYPFVVVGLIVLVVAGWGRAMAEPVKIVVLGDSLSAGYLLPPQEAFPVQLEQALKEKGHDVTVVNAGVSGDTSSGGLSRLDWSVPEDTDAVILELGANDALRGLEPARTRENLDEIVRRLKARGVEVLVAGMLAPRNLGEDYAAAFDPIFAEIAEAHGALLYPFFLDGVAMRPELNLADGMHPTGEGVSVIVRNVLPSVEALISRVGAD
ncbi:arylesterase [Polymorphum gilvum]|uniref:GDSL-like lipase/acylhydrolase, putative n=1 Tax=Polymorphum gilvum (strain LMG 25793 / CGMCC 1.9160 / SL003B-26A1) TaxID=991905 RepID=F2J308_POLGS|nr:arylesterase [Polymorphum gilvum]ADZ68878.1 GDSL-like lipase/acylhydrolase, putative [Polymorphum gilvum SL003B-26A1]